MAGANNEYSRLKFNPFGIKGDLEEVYPQLKSITDGIGKLQEMRKEERQGLQVYVALMYDPESPLRVKHQDYTARRNAAMELAGLTDSASSVIVTQDFAEMAVRFLRLVNSRLWTLIVINEETFNEYAVRVMSPIIGLDLDEKDVLNAATIKTKLMEACDDIHNRLQKYYREITGEDEELTASLETRQKRLTPEQIAKMGSGVQ